MSYLFSFGITLKRFNLLYVCLQNFFILYFSNLNGNNAKKCLSLKSQIIMSNKIAAYSQGT